MKVILLADVKGVGKRDQIIETSDGHARNFLIPKKLAVEATPAYLRDIEAKKKAESRRKIADMETAQELSRTLSDTVIEISVKAGVNGKLFGAVTSKEIASVLSSKTGLIIDRKKILLNEPIKTIGEKQIEVKLHPQVTTKIVVNIKTV
ncbi:MAG: 50S ribosomal protein L9 [Clostridiales bacterium]|nr:50S ribosomal protein L9 [Clostridiales bacterium]